MTFTEETLAVAVREMIGSDASDVYGALQRAAEKRAAGWRLLEQVNQYLGHLQGSLKGTPHGTAVANVVRDFRETLTELAETRPAFKRYYAFNGNICDRQSNNNPICYPRGGMAGLNRLLAALNGAD